MPVELRNEIADEAICLRFGMDVTGSDTYAHGDRRFAHNVRLEDPPNCWGFTTNARQTLRLELDGKFERKGIVTRLVRVPRFPEQWPAVDPRVF